MPTSVESRTVKSGNFRMKSFIFLFVIVLVLEHHGSFQGAVPSTLKSAVLLTDEQIKEARERANLSDPSLAEYHFAQEEARERAELLNQSSAEHHVAPEAAQTRENLSNPTSAEYQTATETTREIAKVTTREIADVSNHASAEYHTAPETEQQEDACDRFSEAGSDLPISTTSRQEYYSESLSPRIGSPFNDRKKRVVSVQNWLYVKEERRRAKAVTLFKNHALELIQAAVRPIRNDSAISGQASSCAKIIKNTKAFASVSLIIQTIQIANKHSRVLQRIAKAEGSFAARRCVRNANLMSSIEKIVDLCLLTENDFVLNSLESILKDHLENLSPDPSFLSKWTSWFNYDEQSATSCFQLMVTIDYNREFFGKFLEGFSIVSRNMRRDAQAITAIVENDEEIAEKRQRLTDIAKELRKLKVQTPDKDFRKGDFEDFCVLMSARSNMEYDKKIDSVKSKVMWLGLFFLAVYTAKGIAWLYR